MQDRLDLGEVEKKLTAREVMDEWELEPILEEIAKALEGQVNGRTVQQTKASVERVKRLHAVADLVK